MASFKIGQRVRITRESDEDPAQRPAGSVGTVVRLFVNIHPARFRKYGDHHLVAVDGVPEPRFGGWAVPICFLSPLTDPKADAFVESVKKWKPLHEEPKREREVARYLAKRALAK